MVDVVGFFAGALGFEHKNTVDARIKKEVEGRLSETRKQNSELHTLNRKQSRRGEDLEIKAVVMDEALREIGKSEKSRHKQLKETYEKIHSFRKQDLQKAMWHQKELNEIEIGKMREHEAIKHGESMQKLTEKFKGVEQKHKEIISEKDKELKEKEKKYMEEKRTQEKENEKILKQMEDLKRQIKDHEEHMSHGLFAKFQNITQKIIEQHIEAWEKYFAAVHESGRSTRPETVLDKYLAENENALRANKAKKQNIDSEMHELEELYHILYQIGEDQSLDQRKKSHLESKFRSRDRQRTIRKQRGNSILDKIGYKSATLDQEA
jgi:DNA repair protein SbcC/Rad50